MTDIVWTSLQKLYDRIIPAKAFWRLSYDWIAGKQPDGFTTMNYGFVEEPIAGAEPIADETLNFALYYHLTEMITIKDKLLLEVGAGRGGGLAHIKQLLQPRLAVGVDLSAKAVALARQKHHHISGLSFLPGDAEALPFGQESFDVVLNVESSHCYPSRLRFYQEVQRVLVPEGYFLYTDFFEREQLPEIRDLLHQAGLLITMEQDITDNVLAALRLDEGRKLQLIEQMPSRLQATFHNFAATTDSETYRSFMTGERKYMMFVIQQLSSKLLTVE